MKFAGTMEHLIILFQNFGVFVFVTFDCISGRYCHCCQNTKFAIFISFFTLNHYTDTVFVMEHQNSPETLSSLSNPPALYPAFTLFTVIPIFCFLPGLCQLPLIYSLRHIQHADIELCNSDGLTPLMIAAVEGSNILCDVSRPYITLAMSFPLPVSL